MGASRTLLCSGMAAAALWVFAPIPADAQQLGLWGGWNERAQGWQSDQPKSGNRADPYYSDPYYDGQGAFPALMDGGPRPLIEPQVPEIIALANGEPPGTILIDTEGRRLYFTLNSNEAYEYPISVGREGFTWTGSETISRIADWPDWYPPQEMRVRDPRLPEKMMGGLRNPLGAKALFLGNSLYRIHGTNDAKTIGFAASSGCFRMLNEHVVHLAALVKVGTVVKVLPRLPQSDEVTLLPWQAEPVGVGAPKRQWNPDRMQSP